MKNLPEVVKTLNSYFITDFPIFFVLICCKPLCLNFGKDLSTKSEKLNTDFVHLVGKESDLDAEIYFTSMTRHFHYFSPLLYDEKI